MKRGLKLISKYGMTNFNKGLGKNESGIVDYIDQGPMRARRKGIGYTYIQTLEETGVTMRKWYLLYFLNESRDNKIVDNIQ
jgi:hypothetical protein